MSLLQVSGRVNRHGLRVRGPLLDFALAPHPLFNRHPAFEQSALVLGELFKEDRVSARWCLEALRRELDRNDIRPFLEQLRREEAACSFGTVEDLFRVISAQTVTVVVRPDLIDRLTGFQPVSFDELQNGSVQLWLGRERRFALPEITPRLPGIFRWNMAYDRLFLGYMDGVIPLLRAGQTGFDVL
jgi:hypothetical protein